MRKGIISSLSDSEFQLLGETEKDRVVQLDEDELLDLHGRVRRARNKYVGVYRRNAVGRIGDTAARGQAYARNQRDRDKAEVFEDALSRVSRQLATAARQASVALRTERLDAVRDRGSGPATSPSVPSSVGPGIPRSHQKTTGGLKRDAGTRAMGARRQAKKDGR
jgi:hypothetical protein